MPSTHVESQQVRAGAPATPQRHCRKKRSQLNGIRCRGKVVKTLNFLTVTQSDTFLKLLHFLLKTHTLLHLILSVTTLLLHPHANTQDGAEHREKGVTNLLHNRDHRRRHNNRTHRHRKIELWRIRNILACRRLHLIRGAQCALTRRTVKRRSTRRTHIRGATGARRSLLLRRRLQSQHTITNMDSGALRNSQTLLRDFLTVHKTTVRRTRISDTNLLSIRRLIMNHLQVQMLPRRARRGQHNVGVRGTARHQRTRRRDRARQSNRRTAAQADAPALHQGRVGERCPRDAHTFHRLDLRQGGGCRHRAVIAIQRLVCRQGGTTGCLNEISDGRLRLPGV